MEFPSVRPGDALRRAKASATKRFGGIIARDKDSARSAVRHPPAVAGVLYKRRSGVTGLAASLFSQGDKSAGNGKYGGRLWVMRYVELRDGVISYHDLPKGFDEHAELGEFSPEPGSERGSIDLRRFGVQLRLSAGHVSHMSHLVAGLQGSGKESLPTEGHAAPHVDGAGTPHGVDGNASLASAAGVGTVASAVAQSMGGSAPSRGVGVGVGVGVGAATPGTGSTPPVSADEIRLDRAPSEADLAGDSPAGAADRDKDSTRSPSPYLMEIIYNNMLLPKEWQSWTLCAPDRKSLFKWTSAIAGIIFNATDEASDFGQDAMTPTCAESLTPAGIDLDPSRPGTQAVRLIDELRHGTDQDEHDFEHGEEEEEHHAAGGPIVPAPSPSPSPLQQQQQQRRRQQSPSPTQPSQRGRHLMLVSTETTPVPASRLSPRRLSSLGASPSSPARVRGSSGSAAASPSLSRLPWALRAVSRADLAVALCVATVLLNAAGERELKPHVQLAALTIAVALLGAAVQALEAGSAQACAAQHELAVTSPRGAGSRRALVPPKLDMTLPASGSALGSASASASASASRPQPQAPLAERAGGLTVPYRPLERAKAEGHCWTDCDDSVLSMRVGPDYRKNGLKAATKPALFKTVGIDLFESEKKLNGVAHAVKAPLDKCVDGALLPEPWPRLLVFNFQLPSPNGMGLSSADGPGYNFACYYTPSEALLEQIRAAEQGKPVEPAVALLRRWFAEAGTSAAVKERLKLVGFILNPDDCGMPGWTQRYNGKPVMIKKSASIGYDAARRIVEYDIDLRVWGMMTRQGIRALLPAALAKMEFIVSLVIQGEENDELPERALTATQLYYLQTDKAVRT